MIVDRLNGQNYAENLADYILSFNRGTWTVASGTGTATLNASNAYIGLSSLRIENNVVASDILVSNASQSTIIGSDGGDFQISFYAKKAIPQEVRVVELLIYKNAVLLDTQSFSLGSVEADVDVDNVWQRCQCDTVYTSAKNDEFTFQFRLKGATTGELTTSVYIDGFMVNKAERGNSIVPIYTEPLYNKTLQLESVVFDNVFADAFFLNQLNTPPSSASDIGNTGEIRIDADYIYVCVASDTWKRVAISTW